MAGKITKANQRTLWDRKLADIANLRRVLSSRGVSYIVPPSVLQQVNTLFPLFGNRKLTKNSLKLMSQLFVFYSPRYHADARRVRVMCREVLASSSAAFAFPSWPAPEPPRLNPQPASPLETVRLRRLMSLFIDAAFLEVHPHSNL